MALSASTPESLIPGDIVVIDRAIETIGSSVAPARQVAQAWEVMALPTWRGQAGSAWNAFAPREAGRIRPAGPALNRAASAMSAYRAAFVSARAEAQEAIVDAVRAERATQQARAEHREAARRAASADPGTPAATLAPFTDPGTTALTAAQARVDAARARLQRIGDEVAAEIRAASGDASGVRAGLRGSQISLASFPVPRGSVRASDPPAADPFGNPTTEDWEQAWPVFQGFGEAAADTVVSLRQLLPIQPIIDELLGKPGWNDYEKRWKTVGEGYAHLRTNPLDALVEWAKNFISYDMWEKEPGRALGHTLFNFAGIAGILKGALKLGAARPRPHKVPATKFATTSQLATEFFGKDNAGKSIKIGGYSLKDLDLAKNPDKVRVVDGTQFGTEAKMRDTVTKYAEDLAGQPLRAPDGYSGPFLRTAKVTRPDGTQYIITVREKSSSSGANNADIRLTLELQDAKTWQVRGWPEQRLELKFNWSGN